ncbi:MAG: ribonuclease R [Bacteroidota bacterium]
MKQKSTKSRRTQPHKPRYIIGQVDYVHPSYAYIITAPDQADIWISKKDLGRALHQDQVQVSVTVPQQAGKRPVGRVVKIISRAKTHYVGLVSQRAEGIFVVPISRRMHYDIQVQPADLQGARINDKVIVKLVETPTLCQAPTGQVIRVLGPAGEHAVEMHAIMAEFELPAHFPAPVVAEAATIPQAIPAREIKRRKDFRPKTTFTIDPTDAKDFDDALSLEILPNGHYEVGIHIADVSYYVPEGSHIDQEAFARGTSVYLVDRTLPMLPERLSNELCSLRPHQDRLAFSAVFEIDTQGTVHSEWFGETVIHSDKRFTYEEAQQVLQGQTGEHYAALQALDRLAKQLRAGRFQQGAIHFETTEVRFQLDTCGKPLAILPKAIHDTNRLIEEFMLLANQRVARHVSRLRAGKHRPTFVYRTHDTPDLAKWSDFALWVEQFGYTLSRHLKRLPASLNRLTANVAGKPIAHIIQSLAIRMMAKALYTTEANPHFGLAFTHYTHFTSPIRRYPDLMVHRLLKQYLTGTWALDARTTQAYTSKCQHASERERIAAEAERASIKYKQVEFMASQLSGAILQGTISGLMEWGMYVALTDTLCEGMVRLADMQDDYYLLDKKLFKLTGQRTKKVYRLGDVIKVQVKACDIHTRTIDLWLAA